MLLFIYSFAFAFILYFLHHPYISSLSFYQVKGCGQLRLALLLALYGCRFLMKSGVWWVRSRAMRQGCLARWCSRVRLRLLIFFVRLLCQQFCNYQRRTWRRLNPHSLPSPHNFKYQAHTAQYSPPTCHPNPQTPIPQASTYCPPPSKAYTSPRPP